MVRAGRKSANRWMLLIHSIPPHPAYFRAKVGKRLARVGAVAIKNSVYVLPAKDETREDFQWIAREIVEEGGEATVCDATFVEGMQDEHIEALFRAARQADFAALGDEARAVLKELGAKPKKDEKRANAAAEAVDAAIGTIEARLARHEEEQAPAEKPTLARYRGRTWVTRKNVHVDRIASAWLVLRFIDPKAKLKFAPGQGYRAKDGEVTFDMFEGTFTHIGDRCTFEVLLDTFGLKDPGLRVLSEIIHDIDVKDGKFDRPESPGFASLVAAIALTKRDDEERIAFGGPILDALLELYRRKRTAPPDEG